MPRSAASVAPKKPVLDTQDHQIGQPSTVTVDPLVVTDTSVQGGDVHETKIEVVDGPAAMEQAEALAFNEELVKVVVHASTNPNDEDPVRVSINGRTIFIWRGQETVVKRMYVERLARAKITAVGQKRAVDSEGNNSYSYPKTSALKYPFAVVEDMNPKGADWLKKILAEPS